MSALDEQLSMQLGTPLRAAGEEPDERLADLDVGAQPFAVEHLGERQRLRLRIVSLQMQFREAQTVALVEQVVDPVAGRMQLEAVPRVRRDECPPPAVLLHSQFRLV